MVLAFPAEMQTNTEEPRGKAMYVRLDVHKASIQIAAIDDRGLLIFNKKIKNDHEAVRRILEPLPKNARYVMESSSVWYGLYRFMTDDMGLDVTLSNPYNTKIIAASVKKTDKVDAFKLADLHRGGYISECFVPNDIIVHYKQLVRHRIKLVRTSTKMKNYIHSITLQNGIKTKGSGFTVSHVQELRKLEDYRIVSYLDSIEFHRKEIAKTNRAIYKAVQSYPDAQLLTSVPGFGEFTALALASEIAGVERFKSSDKLCSYAGIVPSVRNSADTVHHGRITKRGSPIMRHLLVEAVYIHVQHDEDSNISIFYKRLAKKRMRGKAAVAAAAKLLRVSYWILKEKRPYKKHLISPTHHV